MHLELLFHCQCGYIYLLLCVIHSFPLVCFFVLSFVVMFVCLAAHWGGGAIKGIDRPVKVQKQKGEVLKGKQCIIQQR